MFTLIRGRLVRCQSCEKVGISKVNVYYRAGFIFAAIALVAVIYFLSQYGDHKLGHSMSYRPLGFSRTRLSTLALVFGFGAAYLFRTPEAHTCPYCDSSFVRRARH